MNIKNITYTIYFGPIKKVYLILLQQQNYVIL